MVKYTQTTHRMLFSGVQKETSGIKWIKNTEDLAQRVSQNI